MTDQSFYLISARKIPCEEPKNKINYWGCGDDESQSFYLIPSISSPTEKTEIKPKGGSSTRWRESDWSFYPISQLPEMLGMGHGDKVQLYATPGNITL